MVRPPDGYDECVSSDRCDRLRRLMRRVIVCGRRRKAREVRLEPTEKGERGRQLT